MNQVILDIDTVSRVMLGTVCMISAVVAFAFAVVTHPKYTPHMVFIGFYSVWFGLAMYDLAWAGFDVPFIPDRYLVLNLNGASAAVVGGWAVFGFRLFLDARTLRRHVERQTHREQAILGDK